MKKQAFIMAMLLLLFPAGATAGKITLQCEVLEPSPEIKIVDQELQGLRYLLIHHANSKDRETLSNWLKTKHGANVEFFIKGRRYSGLLCRLANCFGRGILIFKADIRPEKRDIIEVILPP